MKKFFTIIFAFTLCSTVANAQTNEYMDYLKKSLNKRKKGINDEMLNKKAIDIINKVRNNKTTVIDTTSAENKEAYESMMNNPLFKKIDELKNDSAAMMEYFQQQYGNTSVEEIGKTYGLEINEQQYKESEKNAAKGWEILNDSIVKKVEKEKRKFTKEEAEYLNKKYGTNIYGTDYEMLYKDSVGVFANIDGKMRPMYIATPENITDKHPIPFCDDINEIKRYVNGYLSLFKKPFADRVITDSTQNYYIFKNAHANEIFNGNAIFTVYYNDSFDVQNITLKDILLHQNGFFSEPVDPKDIIIFKVNRGVNCRYMPYMYSLIKYKESELLNYIADRLSQEGYALANINNKLSDEDLYQVINRLEFEFKVEKLIETNLINRDKYAYSNKIKPAKNVKVSINTRKLQHVTAQDICIEAAPGEYGIVILNHILDNAIDNAIKEETDERERKLLQNLDISVLDKGAYFFTIK